VRERERNILLQGKFYDVLKAPEMKKNPGTSECTHCDMRIHGLKQLISTGNSIKFYLRTTADRSEYYMPPAKSK
jgi:hypothetical protein